MTEEELFASIYTHDTIYLPPSEQKSAALEVALGCSHAKCRFCDFAKDPFHIHSWKESAVTCRSWDSSGLMPTGSSYSGKMRLFWTMKS
ncbi:MAG: hypothetical protein ACLUUO_16485 [Sellimonas intestinalis]